MQAVELSDSSRARGGGRTSSEGVKDAIEINVAGDYLLDEGDFLEIIRAGFNDQIVDLGGRLIAVLGG